MSSKEALFKKVREGVQFNTIFMVIGIFYVRNGIVKLDDLMHMITEAFFQSNGVQVLLLLAVVCVILTFVTGSYYTGVGIFLPLIQMLPVSLNEKLTLTFFIFCWQFFGYYYSPLHLCQLLTIQYTGCDLREVMRENLKILPPLVTGSIILYFFYRWLLS
jgi:hypothetical protein